MADPWEVSARVALSTPGSPFLVCLPSEAGRFPGGSAERTNFLQRRDRPLPCSCGSAPSPTCCLPDQTVLTDLRGLGSGRQLHLRQERSPRPAILWVALARQAADPQEGTGLPGSGSCPCWWHCCMWFHVGCGKGKELSTLPPPQGPLPAQLAPFAPPPSADLRPFW